VPAVDAVLAIDIGGTKQLVAVVDADGGVHHVHRAPTDTADPWRSLVPLVDATRSAWSGPPLVACGVGCGGPMTPGGDAVSPINIEAWRGFPLRAAVAELTGLATVVDNDAKALALGEGWRGAAAGSQHYVGMVVSTGVGGGVVVDGRLLEGASGNAGHIGHVIVEPGGARCGCGARGCLEAEASGTAIARATGRPAAEAPVEVRRRTGTLVGRAVASVVALLDVRLAVVAGSVALGYGNDFFGAANDELAASCRLSFAQGARIVPAGLGGAGPLVGAAALAWRSLGRL